MAVIRSEAYAMPRGPRRGSSSAVSNEPSASSLSTCDVGRNDTLKLDTERSDILLRKEEEDEAQVPFVCWESFACDFGFGFFLQSQVQPSRG